MITSKMLADPRDARGRHLAIGDRVVYPVRGSTVVIMVEAVIEGIEGDTRVIVRREKELGRYEKGHVDHKLVHVRTFSMIKVG